ncbi:hypothetical protein AgCh_018157 [Apium graveolens]
MGTNKQINVGHYILEELSTRLTMPLESRGKEIFLPRFIMSALNYKVNDIYMLEGVNRSLIGNCKQVSKIQFGSLLTKSKVPVSLKLTPFMIERFKTYPYSMPDMRTSAIQLSATMVHAPVEAQTQEPTHVEPVPSKPLAARKPTTSSSQKDEVSKKKRNEVTLTIMNESGEDQTEAESPLVKRSKKTLESNSQVQASDLVQETLFTTQTLQSDGERLLDGVDLYDTITTMGDSSVFTEDPMDVTNAPSCANQSSQTVRFEGSTPEGELSKSSPIQLDVPHIGTTTLKTLAEIALAVDARSTIANDPVKSPPIPLKVPTTSGGQHTVINTEQSVSKIVTSVTGGFDPSIAQPSTSQPQQPHILSQWLQESGFQPTSVDDLLVEQISGLANISQHLLSSDMSNQDYQAIMLTYNEDVITRNSAYNITHLTSVSEGLDFADHAGRAIIVLGALLNSISSTTFDSQHTDWQERAGEEVLQTFGKNTPDVDGLNHLKVKEKIVNDEEHDGNVDAWLSQDFVLEMDQVLARFRNEYVTIRSNSKALTPQDVYDVVTEIYKAQLKTFHLFSKP